MKFYHFTPAHLLESVLNNGLTMGKLPILDEAGNPVSFISPCQWLTDDGDWDTQSWATRKLVPYNRTAFRLLIVISKSSRKLLWRAYECLPHLPSPTQRLITDWEGSEHWFLFFGRIRSGWIRKVDSKEGKK